MTRKKRAATMISRVKGCIRSKKLWSEEMHQYSFINHSLHKWPNWVSNIIHRFGLNEAVCSCLYAKTRDVEIKLKKLIFEEIKRKGNQASKSSVAKEISSSKGEWTLLDYNCGPEIHFSVSQDVEYDECVLMWHIATEIFYFSSKAKNPPPPPIQDIDEGIYQDGDSSSNSSDDVHDADICRYISEYLLYILVMEQKMVTVDIRFRDTFEEAANFFNTAQQKRQKTRGGCFSCISSSCSLLETFFKDVKKACGLYLSSMMISTWEDIKYVFTLRCFTTKGRKRKPTEWEQHQNTLEDQKRKEACGRLKLVTPQVKPSEIRGNRTKSMFFDARILAGHLERLCNEENGHYSENQVWEMMSKVWVELLSYGACHCRGNAHAQSLTKGGELRTFVWLLMAHFGMGDQFRNDDGAPRAKLIVGKEDIN